MISVGSLLLGIALLILIGLFVLRPLVAPQDVSEMAGVSKRRAVEAQKEVVLEEIRILDFDFDTGKISEEVYQALRSERMAEATELLRQLDALPAAPGREDALEVDIEAAIAGARQRPAASLPVVEDEVEAAIARRRQTANGAAAAVGAAPALKVKQAGFCSQCGESLDADDRFCAACGHRLA